jgi:DNA polymerase (family X)
MLEVPGVTQAVYCGSLRRFSETVGDVDVVVAASAAGPVMEAFVAMGFVDRVLVRGDSKTSVVSRRGTQVDLRVVTPQQLGAALLYFTGSKGHNIKLRQRALSRGWTLNEYALSESASGRVVASESEEQIYQALGLPFIPPVLREDAGEIEAALAGALPDIVDISRLRGDLHSHSDWTDGVHSIEVMADAARRRGYAYQVLTDHTQSLAIARGMTPDQVAEQRLIVARLNERYAAEEAAGTAPPESSPDGFRLLHGCELEIRADGALDFEDDLLAGFDLVVASLHVSRRQPRADLTRRTLNAIRSPHVDVIAHPAGRMLGGRDDLDLDWDQVYSEAARTGTALEINGSPHRLDLAVERARRAVADGCLLSIDSDAHKTTELDYVRWGISQARRAWVRPDDVVNTRDRDALLAWAAGKPGRT